MKTRQYELEGDVVKSPVPEFVFTAPETSRAYKFLIDPDNRIHLRSDCVQPVALIVSRMLQMAIRSAYEAVKEPSHNPYTWEKLRDQAKKATDALAQVRKALSTLGPEESIGLRRCRYGSETQERNIIVARQTAERDLATLETAAELLAQLALDADRRRRELFGDKQNPGRPDQKAFVHYLIEGWVYLTGAMPPRSKSGNTLFDRFACEAWDDWHGEGASSELSFTSQTANCLKELSPQRLQDLMTPGPSWVQSL